MPSNIKDFAKRIVAGNLFFSIGKKERFFFLFHDISDPSEIHHSDQYSSNPQNFYTLMEYIARKFELVNIDFLVSEATESTTGKPLASISFDDGFYSVYKKAYPYLRERNIPFTLFVNKRAVSYNQIWFTNLVLSKGNKEYWEHFYNTAIDKSRISLNELKETEIWKIFNYIKPSAIENLPEYAKIDSQKYGKIFCDESDLKEMHKSGMASIHSHSVHHFILAECNRELSFKEIKENKLFVEVITGEKDVHFALPFGKEPHYDLRILEQCRDLDYKYMYTTNPNAFNMANIEGNKLSLIPRISITNQSIVELMFMINMGIVKKRKL
jgi:peptidoglycan/xylan/chitin deacetylase (PgdA/CDA1 family)